jgi:hypothetical protein
MKKYLPHLIAVAAFVVITMIYFSPLFNGKELRQSDINNWKGMSKEIMDFKEKSGEDTYWTNSMFGGMPGYQIAAVYSANLIQYIDKVITLGLPAPANYLFLFMVGFYFLLITLKVDNKIAIVGSIAFAFNCYFLIAIEAGHNTKAHAIGFMAPVVAGIILSYRGKYLLGAAITSLFLALELYANHLQITYYLMLTVIIFVILEFVRAYKEKKITGFIKSTAFLGIGAALAVLSSITNLWATQEYGKYSTRGPSELTSNKENQTTGLDRDYITDWSYGIGETITLFIPDFKGGASEPISKNNKDALKDVDPNFKQYVGSFGSYFGDQPFTLGPYYIGAIIILLFVIGAFVVEGSIKWWLLSATALSILLSWGKNFMGFTNLFLDFVPGYDKFRAVAMILVIAAFAVPLLAIIAVNKMVTENDFFKKYKKKLIYSLGGVLGIAFLITVAPGMFTGFYTSNEYDQVAQSVKGQQNSQELLDSFFSAVSSAREHIVKSDALRTLMLLLFTSVLIWTFLKFRYKKEFFIFGLLALILIDLAPVGRRYLQEDDFVKKSANAIPYPMTLADQYILQDTSPSYRVLNIAVNTFNDASTSYYHQSIGGYHGAKLKRYKEVIDSCLTEELAVLRMVMQKPDSSNEGTIYSQPVINMMNTKYIVYNAEAPPLLNRGALGNAWFVNSVKMVPNADAEIVAIKNFDPRSTAFVDQKFEDKLKGFNIQGADSASSIILTKYKPNHLTYQASASAEKLAVFSEIYYDKGWNAYVDGKPADYFRANYILRAMRVPQGNHTIEFKFEPKVITTGEKVSFAGSLIILLFVAFAVWSDLKKKPENAG